MVTRNVKISGYITALAFVFGTVFTIYIKGSQQIHWAYPAFVVIFYFLQPKTALLLACLAIFAILPVLEKEETLPNTLKILITLFVNVSCAFIFSKVMRNQSKDLRELAQKDPLTQIGNRNAMEFAIKDVFEEYVNDDKPMPVLMVDIDHFKEINDTLGHQTGDDIIVKVAELIEFNMRSSESVYRYGGEEFLVLAKNMSIFDAENLAERLRATVENAAFLDDIKITISVGISELTAKKSTKHWVEQADKALYQAKNKGRNCVVTFDDEHKTE